MNESEHIEKSALQALHEVATEKQKASLGLAFNHIERTAISVAQALPESAIIINRSIGLDLQSKTFYRELKHVLNCYQSKNIDRYFLHLTPNMDRNDMDQVCSELNLREARAWQKFELSKEQFRPVNHALTIEQLSQIESIDFGKIICRGFDLGEDAIPWLSRLPHHKDWHIFIAKINGETAAVGGVFIKDKKAWLDLGATAPNFRCQGCQSALLSARIEHALKIGCQHVFTCTGVDVAGDPQHSYKNILKVGFKPSYIRVNLEPQ